MAEPVDVLVLGGGPAALCIASELNQRGVAVAAIAPDPVDDPWPTTYGIWADELKAVGLEPLLEHRWSDTVQEILGDMHNLFGDTDAVNVSLKADGYSFSEPERGDRADELLSYVHFDPQQMLSQYQEKLAAAELTDQQRTAYLADLKIALNSTTYLTV